MKNNKSRTNKLIKKGVRAASVGVLSLMVGFGLAGCETKENVEVGSTVREWTIDAAYATAQDEGFTGTYEEFLASLANIKSITINDQGHLIFTLSNGSTVDAGYCIGTRGATGSQGIQGEKGDKGDTGATGAKGVGIAEVNAVSGTSYTTITIELTNGNVTEFTVPNGAKGAKGDQGEQGIQGEKGEQGLRGIQGVKGDKGEDGLGIANIVSNKVNGVTTVTITYTDESSYQYQINDGAKGDTGAAGRGVADITSVKENGVTTVTITYTDEETLTFTIMDGAKGDKGDKGDQGIQGEKGEKGDTGAAGAKGDKGDQGEQGIQGEKGEKGDTGAAGAKGDKGDQGAQGVSIVSVSQEADRWGLVSRTTYTYSDSTVENPHKDVIEINTGIQPYRVYDVETAEEFDYLWNLGVTTFVLMDDITLNHGLNFTQTSNLKYFQEFELALNYAIDLNLHDLTIDISSAPNSAKSSIVGQDVKVGITGRQTENDKGGIIYTGFAGGSYYAFNIKKNAELYFEGLKMFTDGTALYPQGDTARVSVDGCEIIAGTYCVGTNANTVDNYNVVIELCDSTFRTMGYSFTYDAAGNVLTTDSDDACIMINVPGTLNIENCELTGNRQGLIVRSGTANISNTTISHTGGFADKTKYYNSNWGSGDELPSAAVVVGNRSSGTAYDYPAILNIINSRIFASSSVDTAIYVYGTSEDNFAQLNRYGLYIEGEVINGNEGAYSIIYDIPSLDD